MKYIRLRGQATLILFPDWMPHADMARERFVSSAGFVDTETWTCYGDSISLGIESNPDSDTPILRTMIKPLASAA